jgi:hypothetical protein
MLGAITAYRCAAPGAFPTWLLPALAVVGLGAGLFTPAFFTRALKPLRVQELGSAAGLLNAVQQLGATLGVAILGSVYLAGAKDGSGGASGSLYAVQVAFWSAVGLVGVSACASWVMGREGGRGREG